MSWGMIGVLLMWFLYIFLALVGVLILALLIAAGAKSVRNVWKHEESTGEVIIDGRSDQ